MLNISIRSILFCNSVPSWVSRITPSVINNTMGEPLSVHKQDLYLDTIVKLEELDYGAMRFDYYDGIVDTIFFRFFEHHSNEIGKIRIVDYDEYAKLTLSQFAMFLNRHKMEYKVLLPFADDGLIIIDVQTYIGVIMFDFNLVGTEWKFVNCNFQIIKYTSHHEVTKAEHDSPKIS